LLIGIAQRLIPTRESFGAAAAMSHITVTYIEDLKVGVTTQNLTYRKFTLPGRSFQVNLSASF
jgi:hypothetical protein